MDNGKKSSIKKTLKWMGHILSVLSMLYIFRKISVLSVELDSFNNCILLFIVLFLVSVISLLGNVIIAILWMRSISFVHRGLDKEKKIPLICVWLKANIQKYIPGNVIQYAGRGVLCTELGMMVKDVTMASILEIINIIIAAVLFCLVFSYWDLYQFLVQNVSKNHIMFGMFLSAIVVIVIGVFFLIKKRELHRIGQTLRFFFINQIGYYINFVITGFSFFLIVVFLFERDVDLNQVLFANTLSWLAGYIVVGSPGGIGVRETVFLWVFPKTLVLQDIAISVCIMRIGSIIADIGGAVIATVTWNRCKAK